MSSKDIKLGVSLYSYQEAIWRGDLDLSGALTAVKGCGATGVEIFGEALMPSFPYVSNEFLYEWNYWMDNLQLEPVCYEHFADRRFSPNPDEYLTDDDLFDMTLQYLRSAKKLGCSLIRLSHTGHNGKRSENFTPDPGRETINPETSERLLPYAQDLGGAMALELHAPGVLQDGGNDAFLEAIDRTGCYGGGGLMLDLSACFRDISPMLEDSYVAQGAKREIVQYMRKIDKKANTFDGNNQVDVYGFAAAVDADGKVIKGFSDCVQVAFGFDTTGKSKFDTTKEIKSKFELGSNYGMTAIGKQEWYIQAAAFDSQCIGKTAAEIVGLMSDDGKGVESVQTAGCTIYVTGFVKAASKI